MARTCRFCLQSDLPDGALKCRACGSWLDPAHDEDQAEAFRRSVRQDLQTDLKEHRGFLEGLLSQLKFVAATIVAAGLAAAVFFGVRTDQSISDTSARIGDAATKQIETATTEITAKSRASMTAAIEARVSSPETTELIETTMKKALDDQVRGEVDKRSDEISRKVGEEIADARAYLDSVIGEINAMQTRSDDALKRLGSIETSFADARNQTVEGSQSVLPVEMLQVEGKGDLSHLDGLIERKVEALSFSLDGFYLGPVAWRYLDRLRTLPKFRYVVLYAQSDSGFLGVYDAAVLAAALDPPDTIALSAALGPDSNNLPNEDAVPGWTAFATALGKGELGWLSGLPSFRPVADAVHADWSSLQALDHMERLGLDRLPVVGTDGSFAGVIDRSRLTTRVLLEIAGGTR